MDDDLAVGKIDSAHLRCSFCGKPYSEVETMICGPTPAVAICDGCVEMCTEIIAGSLGPAEDA